MSLVLVYKAMTLSSLAVGTSRSPMERKHGHAESLCMRGERSRAIHRNEAEGLPFKEAQKGKTQTSDSPVCMVLHDWTRSPCSRLTRRILRHSTDMAKKAWGNLSR